ncbi:MAG: DNA-3-methyladenine glycosylase 2 family protein [Actinobacteria bacterium]|nr:DNA-3-methyladenine glycosylase 2 family protein [Actinomycetota bacterium]
MGVMDLDFDACYSAISSRDPRFDGRFFTAVSSTQIYCRPICPARTPFKRNVTFYSVAAAAEAAGFRPCRRCRPEASPDTPDWNVKSDLARRAVELINDGILDEGLGADLASLLHVSERQLRRVFETETGTSPAAFARHRRLQRARLLIDKTEMPLTEVAWAAGYTSIRQFNDQIREMFGAPPTALRRSGVPRVRHQALLSLRLSLKPPFDHKGLLSFLSAHLIAGVEMLEGNHYRRVARVPSGTAIIEVTFAPKKDAVILKPRVVDGEPLAEVVEGVRALYDLDADPRSIDAVLAKDRLLKASVRKRPGLRVPGAFDPFEIAIRTVIGQQVSVAGASTITKRLVGAYGAPISSGAPGLSHAFPTPEVLADASLTGLGLTTARMATIRTLAAAVSEEHVVLKRSGSAEHLTSQLLALKGIGPWTASYIAMRIPQDPDAFPAADLGVKKAFARLGGTGDVETWSARWRPWRSYAVMHLWAGL